MTKRDHGHVFQEHTMHFVCTRSGEALLDARLDALPFMTCTDTQVTLGYYTALLFCAAWIRRTHTHILSTHMHCLSIKQQTCLGVGG